MPLSEVPPDSVRVALESVGHVTTQKEPSPNGSKPPRNGRSTGEAAGTTPVESLPLTEISLAADITADGMFGERWLIIDDKRLLVASVRGESDARVDIDLPLVDIKDCSVENLVGSSALLLTLKSGSVVEAVRYTTGLATEFGAASRWLQARLKGEEPAASIAGGLDKKVCPTCGDPLPADTNVCPRCIKRTATLARLLRYALPYKSNIVLITVLMISSTLFSTLPPVFQQRLVDDVLIPHQHRSWIAWILCGVVGVSALGIVLGILRGRATAKVSNHMVYTLRTEAYARLQELSLSYYDKRQTGSLLARVTQDANELQNFMVDGIQFFLVNSLQILIALAIMMYYDWKLTLLILLPLPITVVLTQRTFRMLWGRLHRLWFLRSNLSGTISSVLSGVRVVKAFAQEQRETDRFQDKARELFNAGVFVEQSWATYFPILGFIAGFGVYIIWYFGGVQVFANVTNRPESGMTVGILGMFLSFSMMLVGPLQAMTRIADWLSRSVASAERVFEVIDAEPEIANVATPVRMEHVEGRVELRNVRFSYDKNQIVLDDVSIDVAPGEMIGLVGHSGAGKSTIINLLSRFYDVMDGEILIDGVNIREIDLDDLRRQIGIVLQEPFLFPGTIRENIAYAKPDASPEEVMRAAKAANAHEFVMRFTDGYDTFVGERGVRLSGGERQRLSIARAILHDPRILILDEATASVDTETEKQIQEAVGRLIHGRTTFAIAHRLSTLRNASRLMVIERGKLVECGTHDELMAKPDGVFKKLVEMQQQVNQLRVAEEWIA